MKLQAKKSLVLVDTGLMWLKGMMMLTMGILPPARWHMNGQSLELFGKVGILLGAGNHKLLMCRAGRMDDNQ